MARKKIYKREQPSKPERPQRKTTRTKKYREINVKAKTNGQQEYLELIESKDVIVCNGQAGTGKTLLAVGMALKLLKEKSDTYKRIVMIRPAVTVKGEELGFLPGDIDDKMKPFMMPMLDSLKFFLTTSEWQTLIDNGTIEISPISHMRGRTFNNCLMIFDEAQNSTISQMKMVVTRMGFSSKLIIEGDVSQSDLHGDDQTNNGLRDAMLRFVNVDGVGVVRLTTADVVRSPMLQRILKTYE